MIVNISAFNPLDDIPKIGKGFKFTHVMILLKGEKSFSEGVFGESGFSWGYDEKSIKDEIKLWSYMPSIR